MNLLALLALSVLCVQFTQAADTCQSRCGLGFDPNYSCQCNDDCSTFGDCCSDYDTTCDPAMSCQGRCGESYDTTNPCHCNDVCGNYGNCCDDYDNVCGISSDPLMSCVNRCGESYDSTNPCHCNDKCTNYGNCCDDYTNECGAVQDELSLLATRMYNGDVNAAADGDIVLNIGGLISDTSKYTDLAPSNLFTYVNPSLLERPSYDAYIKLMDNYIRVTGTAESETSVEKAEIESFLDGVMNSYVMQEAHSYLVGKGLASSSLATFRGEVRKMWFDMYSRTVSGDSSGFEHVFVGEVKNSAVSGFHGWVNLYLEETSGSLNYHGHTKYDDAGVLGTQFEWYGYYKKLTSVFMGRSPEFEMAMFTVCFLEYPDAQCRFNIDGMPLSIQTWSMYNDYIGSAYVI